MIEHDCEYDVTHEYYVDDCRNAKIAMTMNW